MDERIHPIREDLAWAAGLFEGEGCISVTRRTAPRLAVTSTDPDVLERFQQIVGVGKLYPKRMGAPHHKPQQDWVISRFEECQAVIAMLWPWLCERRRERAHEVFSAYLTKYHAARRACRAGHLYTEETLYVNPEGERCCRTCNVEYSRKYRDRRRTKAG